MVIRWDPRHLYRTLLYVFGKPLSHPAGEPGLRKVKPVDPPFNPPLTAREFRSARDLYKSARVSAILGLGSRLRDYRPVLTPSKNLADRWPALPFDWEVERALGKLFFAGSKREQQHARQLIKQIAERGSRRRRAALRKARIATPQSKRAISSLEMLKAFLPRLAELEFTWAFLRGEAMAYTGAADRAGRACAAAALAKHHPFLELSAAEIADGLRTKNHVERQIAAQFSISQASVRTLLNRSAP